MIDSVAVLNPDEANHFLANVALEVWLLTSHGVEGGQLPDGRAWERHVLDQLVRPQTYQFQNAGQTTLFEQSAASGCRHEIDAAVRGSAGTVIAECKSVRGGITKSDVAVFDAKTFDYYAAQMPTAATDIWWRFMVSAAPASDKVRRLCSLKGIILIEPGRVPWPVLCWLAGRPSADVWLRESLLREALRIGPRACTSMQQRWVYDHPGGLRWDLDLLTSADLDDLAYVQEELGQDWLDLLDREAPGWLEMRAEPLIRRLRGSHSGVLDY